MERDYKPADIAVLLNKIVPSATINWDTFPLPGYIPDKMYEPSESEKALLQEYRSDERLRSAVHAVQSMSVLRLDNVGLDVKAIVDDMKTPMHIDVYHNWQAIIEKHSGISIYDLAPKMGF